ncbi:MAG: GC-type dockerin domain-anchored protein, partial [Phycisphaerales bacterium]
GEGDHPVAFNDHSTGWQGAVQQGGFPGIIVNSTSSGPAACNAADVAGLGGSPGHDGQNTVDDLVYYLSQFFAGNTAVADLTDLGGTGGPDGQITVDDLVAFLGAFFSPCNP